jgi:glycosyltransferase involved in cell wall biosynthesis
MAAGRPVVASDVGGISDVVDDTKNGFLVPHKDPHVLADRLVRVLNPDVAAPMGDQARKTAHQYDWQQIGQVCDEMIRTLIRPK